MRNGLIAVLPVMVAALLAAPACTAVPDKGATTDVAIKAGVNKSNPVTSSPIQGQRLSTLIMLMIFFAR